MSLDLIQKCHQRYLLMSDQFKSIWTLNQVLGGIYKHFLNQEVPYKLDFRALYNQIRGLPQMFSGFPGMQIEGYISKLEEEIQNFFNIVEEADSKISPSSFRRFFETYKNEEEEDKILLQLIKFYIHLQRINDDIRDKLDFLITRVASIYSPSEGRFILKDREYLKELFYKLMAIGKLPPVDQRQKEDYLILLQELRREVIDCKTLEDFVLSGVLKAIRSLKNKMDIAFLHPDILVKVAELNITTKNRYIEIYKKEEESLLEETTRIKSLKHQLEEGDSKLQKDLKRIEEIEQLLQEAKEKGDVKLEIIAQYKNTIKGVLSKLDADFTFEQVQAPEEEQKILETKEENEEDILNKILQQTTFPLENYEKEALKSFEVLKNLSYLKDQEKLILKGLCIRFEIEKILDKLISAYKGETVLPEEIKEKVKNLISKGETLEKDFQYAIEDCLFQGKERDANLYLKGKYRLLRSLSGVWLLLDKITENA
ncbi:MAG: hypothetical protein WHV67_05885 [Thermoanaerobaculia bacterium]